MELGEQINTFQEFIEKEYFDELVTNIRNDQYFLNIDFGLLSMFNPDLAQFLLDNPEDTIRAAEKSIESFDIKLENRVFIRFKNLPDSQKIRIRNIRSKHIEQLLEIEGIVRQKTDVRPQVTSARFECPSCGNIIPVLQLEEKFREPSSCPCGRKGKFRLLSKKLVDTQRMVLEENPKDNDGGEQPKRFNVLLKNDLVSPMSEKKTNPGSGIKISGTIKEIPITLNQGGQSTRFDLILEANYVEALEEDFSQIKISSEEEEEIKKLSRDPAVFQKLVTSLAPNIYGHEKIKEALIMQLVGGVYKKRGSSKNRGDIHVLLIGDPGSGKCVTGDTLIQLANGNIKTIKNIFDEEKLDLIRENAYSTKNKIELISFNEQGKNIVQKAPTLWKRYASKLFEIKLASGSILKVTENHPLFTTNNCLISAIEAKNLKKGMFIATPNKISTQSETQFLIKGRKSKSNNAKNIISPKILNKELARLLGYLIGDGWVEKTNYKKIKTMISLTNDEKEVLDDYKKIVENNFKITTKLRNSHKGKTAKEIYTSNSELHSFLTTNFSEIMNNSGEKSVPKKILLSNNEIVKEFLKALFECDGHSNKNKRSIEYSTKSKLLAEQIKFLLLRFGINSRLKTKLKAATNTKEKIKRTYYEIIISGKAANIYQEEIGFVSKRKNSIIKTHKTIMNTNVDVLPKVNKILKALRTNAKKTIKEMSISYGSYRHYEKGDRLPSKEQFKKILSIYQENDELLRIAKEFVNSEIFWDQIISIKEINKECEVYDFEVQKTHNFIANTALIHNSQLLKRISQIAPKGRFVSGKGASLDYDEPLLIKENNQIKLESIGSFVERNCEKKLEKVFLPLKKPAKTLSFNPKTYNLEWKEIKYGYRHKTKEKLYQFFLETGRNIKVTGDHSIFVLKNNKINNIAASNLKKDDVVLIPKQIKNNNSNNNLTKEMAILLGYFIAEGHIRNSQSSYKIEFTINKKEQDIFKEINNCSKKLFKKDAKQYPHGKNGLRVTIYGKEAHNKFKEQLGEVYGKKAKEKRIPQVIFNTSKENQELFIKAYLKGDFGVTKSKGLMSDLLYLYLEQNIIAGFNERDDEKEKLIENRIIYGKGNRFDLKSPHPNKQYSNRYLGIPLEQIDKELINKYCQNILNSDYKRLKWNKLSYLKLIERILFVGERKEVKGPVLTKKYSKSVMEYFKNNQEIYKISKIGRTNIISLTKKGNLLFKKLQNLKNICKSDFGFVRIKKIEKVDSSNKYVYDVSVPGYENFVGGMGGIICHNTGAGLTASVVRDEFLKGWALEAGALVLANKGICCIDELDKMTDDDRSAMHEALEQQTITIAKANIQATLRSETTVLAAANPKFGRFDPYELLAKQIDLPNTLINRFDLIFPVRDLPNKINDDKLASFLLSLHKQKVETPTEIDQDLLRKYIAYIRTNCNPELTTEAIAEIKKYYLKMRGGDQGENDSIKAIPISARQLEALVRLSEASAKIRMGSKVTKRDAKIGIDLVHHCLSQIGMDPDTGKIDIDRLTTGITAKQRSTISTVKEIIMNLEATVGKVISIEDIIREAEINGLNEDQTQEIIDKLKRAGDLFSPKEGFVSRI